MAKKQKSKVKVKEDIEDKLADNSLSQNGDTGVDQESISELAENETDNAIKLEDKIADLEEALLRSRAELDNAFKRNIKRN